MAKIICNRCDRKVDASKDDIDFCQECFNAIENSFKTIMPRTRAAVAILNSGYFGSGERHQSASIYAFLSIFHPEMSHAQKIKLSR